MYKGWLKENLQMNMTSHEVHCSRCRHGLKMPSFAFPSIYTGGSVAQGSPDLIYFCQGEGKSGLGENC